MNRFILTSVTIAAMLAGTAVAQQGGGRETERAQEIERRAQVMIERSEQLQEFAAVQRGRIGLALAPVHEALAVQLGLNAEEVILVEGVMPGCSAEEAGVKTYDIITSVDGESPVTHEVLRNAVLSKEPGEVVRLTVLRAGEKHEIDVPVRRLGPPDERMRLGRRGAIADLDLPPGQAARGLGRQEIVALRAQDAEEMALRIRERLEARGIEAMPRIELWREGERGARMFVPQRPGPGFGPAMPLLRESLESHEQRIERIEQRLERIEKMLEQLLESTQN